MGRRTLVELAHLGAGLGLTFWLTSEFADSYRMGARDIWWCGTAAALATLALSVGPVRRALAADRGAG